MHIWIDFEYNSTQEAMLNLVCCSLRCKDEDVITNKNFWLYNSPEGKEELKKFLLLHKDDSTFISFAAEAEARSFLSLGLNPIEFKWVDLYLEYWLITNHSELSYGKHLMKSGVRFLANTCDTMKDNGLYYYGDALKINKEAGETGKIEHNLAAATYRMLGIHIDTFEKEDVRKLIISNNGAEIISQRNRIMSYCAEDVAHLPALMLAIFKWLRPQCSPKDFAKEVHLRGEYAARSAVMTTLGYPINVEATKTFINNIEDIQVVCRKDINEKLKPLGIEMFHKDKTGWHMREKVVQEWVRDNLDTSRWAKTDGGAISLSADALEEQGANDDNPSDSLLDQLLRWKKLESSIRGFKDPVKSTGKKLFDFLGSDSRIRPYFGIYGSQSSRSQPSATSYIFLKSAWIRILVQPPKGKVIIACDYSSQEFLISALVSKDDKMKAAYASGDVYLGFAYDSGKIKEKIPAPGTKEYKEYKKKYARERDESKSLVLGLSYLMGAKGLAKKLTDDGKKYGLIVTQEEAQKLSDLFKKAYPNFSQWQQGLQRSYRSDGDPIIVPCGWRMFGQNPNVKSVVNFPIQGAGASIMRKAVALCQDAGLSVVMTLHDCVYIQADFDMLGHCADMLKDKMVEAFDFYFPNSGIRGDIKAWGYGLPPTKISRDGKCDTEKLTTPKGNEVEISEYHIDKRGLKEWLNYSKYVMPEWRPPYLEEELDLLL